MDPELLVIERLEAAEARKQLASSLLLFAAEGGEVLLAETRDGRPAILINEAALGETVVLRVFDSLNDRARYIRARDWPLA